MQSNYVTVTISNGIDVVTVSSVSNGADIHIAARKLTQNADDKSGLLYTLAEWVLRDIRDSLSSIELRRDKLTLQLAVMTTSQEARHRISKTEETYE